MSYHIEDDFVRQNVNFLVYEAAQTQIDTICPYYGVGCTLTLHVQDKQIVKVTSPLDHDVDHGHLCIKGRFGRQFVQLRTERSNGKTS